MSFRLGYMLVYTSQYTLCSLQKRVDFLTHIPLVTHCSNRLFPILYLCSWMFLPYSTPRISQLNLILLFLGRSSTVLRPPSIPVSSFNAILSPSQLCMSCRLHKLSLYSFIRPADPCSPSPSLLGGYVNKHLSHVLQLF